MSQQLIFNPPHNHYPYNEYEIQLLQHSHNPYEVKHRKRTSRFQLSVLEATFAENPRPSSAVKKQIAAQTNMSIRGIQVWFQNRRAKAKNQLLKGTANNQAKAVEQADDNNDDQEPQPGQSISPTTSNTAEERASTPRVSPIATADSNLAPPANLALRRGSAPAPLGNVPPYALDSHNPVARSPSSAEVSPSEQPSPLGYRKPFPPPSRLPTDHLSRRRSLPAFHPEHQALYQQRNHLSASNPQSQPYVPSSSHRIASGPYPGAFGRFSIRNSNAPSNHGGVYRSGSNPGPLQPPPSSFKLPPVPTVWNNQPQDPSQPYQFGAQADDASNPPYTYPPRRVSDVSAPGPLPQEGFSFGHHDDPLDHENGHTLVRDSPGPMGDNESIFEPASGLVNFTNPQAYRFGSMASIASSILSVDTDVSGTTGTTAASSAGNSLPSAGGAAALPLPGGLGLSRSRLPPGAGVIGGGGSGYNPNFSFGSGNTTLQPQDPMQYPAGFDPDSRRASCPAHFVNRFSSLGVEQGQPFNQSFGNLAARKGYGPLLKRSPSGIGPGFGLVEGPPTSQGPVPSAISQHHQRRQPSLSTSSIHESDPLQEPNGWAQSNMLALPQDSHPSHPSPTSTDTRHSSYGSQTSNSPNGTGMIMPSADGLSAAGGLLTAGTSVDRFSEGCTPPGKPSPSPSASTPTFLRAAANDSRDSSTPNTNGIYPVYEGGFTHQLYAVSENEQCGSNGELYTGTFSMGSTTSASPEASSGFIPTSSTSIVPQPYGDGTHDYATSDLVYPTSATFDHTSFQQPALYSQDFQYAHLPDSQSRHSNYTLSSDPSQYHPSSLTRGVITGVEN